MAGAHRRAATLVVAVAASLALAAPAHAVSSAQIAQVINAERQANGLPAVREDPALSAGCADYDNYRRMNGSLNDAFTPGGEDSSKPGYTVAGSHASRDSLLNAGDRPADSFANGDVFDDAPNHLEALMDPGVAVIGADQLDFFLNPFLGSTSLACVDVRSARSRPRPRRLRVYGYVGPNGKAPRNPTYREGPAGSGPWIFLYFDAPKGARVTLRSLTLRRADGTTNTPTDVTLSGGLRDGRRRAGAAGKKPSVRPSKTPAVSFRDLEPAYDPADDLDWIGALMHTSHGKWPVPFS